MGHQAEEKQLYAILFLDFYEIDNGDILIDNKSIYDVKLDSLRENIGIVQQEVFFVYRDYKRQYFIWKI